MSVVQLSSLSKLRIEGLIRYHKRVTRHFSYFAACPNFEQQHSLLLMPMMCKTTLVNKDKACCSSKNLLRPQDEFFHSVAARLFGKVNMPALKPSEITESEYEICAEETLDSLTEFFEDLPENESCSEDYDCAYGAGVLTVHIGCDEGTYVLNKQCPNKQIWLSSPLSGPKRYDYFDGQWIYLRDGKGLHHLLEEELTEILGFKIKLKNCKLYSWGIHDAK
uniref:ferroxidase n=1 Tax=Arion vulgaris TaxID=1028688 RepID=A0A0B6ZJR4_9EUPU